MSRKRSKRKSKRPCRGNSSRKPRCSFRSSFETPRPRDRARSSLEAPKTPVRAVPEFKSPIFAPLAEEGDRIEQWFQLMYSLKKFHAWEGEYFVPYMISWLKNLYGKKLDEAPDEAPGGSVPVLHQSQISCAYFALINLIHTADVQQRERFVPNLIKQVNLLNSTSHIDANPQTYISAFFDANFHVWYKMVAGIFNEMVDTQKSNVLHNAYGTPLHICMLHFGLKKTFSFKLTIHAREFGVDSVKTVGDWIKGDLACNFGFIIHCKYTDGSNEVGHYIACKSDKTTYLDPMMNEPQKWKSIVDVYNRVYNNTFRVKDVVAIDLVEREREENSINGVIKLTYKVNRTNVTVTPKAFTIDLPGSLNGAFM